jgi:hypothetical protein
MTAARRASTLECSSADECSSAEPMMPKMTLQAKAELERRDRFRVWHRWYRAVLVRRACISAVQAAQSEHEPGNAFDQAAEEAAEAVQPEEWAVQGGWRVLEDWAERFCTAATEALRQPADTNPGDLPSPPFYPTRGALATLKASAGSETPDAFSAAALAMLASMARNHIDFLRHQTHDHA